MIETPGTDLVFGVEIVIMWHDSVLDCVCYRKEALEGSTRWVLHDLLKWSIRAHEKLP